MPRVTGHRRRLLRTNAISGVIGVVTQAVSLDSKSIERMAVVVTMPSNINNKAQISVDFVPWSNGAKILVYDPRGKLANMPGMEQMDTNYVMRALEKKLMERRENIDELIINPIGITLDKACDPNKKTLITVFKAPDGDTVAIILLEVPSKNDYGKRDNGNSDAVMLHDDD
jgi:hypothetical protein